MILYACVPARGWLQRVRQYTDTFVHWGLVVVHYLPVVHHTPRPASLSDRLSFTTTPINSHSIKTRWYQLDSYFRNSGNQCFVITISRVSQNGDFAVTLYHYYVRVLAQVSRDLKVVQTQRVEILHYPNTTFSHTTMHLRSHSLCGNKMILETPYRHVKYTRKECGWG